MIKSPFGMVARLLLMIGVSALVTRGALNPPLSMKSGEVVVFLGGADVAAAQFSSHLETLLTVAAAGQRVHFRNLGWEGDTVFEQPRDFGFPPLLERVRRMKPSILFLQYGRAEALDQKYPIQEFRRAYQELLVRLDGLAKIILVTPVPFEKADEPLPDLSRRNVDLGRHAQVIREIGKEKSLDVIDLFAALGGGNSSKVNLTMDGLQLTSTGHAVVATTFMRECGLDNVAKRAGELAPNGSWASAELESLRQIVVSKNRLWFDYSRPQNWAFLGGDRVTQPSSRDHRDPNKRWFPEEMEKFTDLIAQKEQEIWKMAEALK